MFAQYRIGNVGIHAWRPLQWARASVVEPRSLPGVSDVVGDTQYRFNWTISALPRSETVVEQQR